MQINIIYDTKYGSTKLISQKFYEKLLKLNHEVTLGHIDEIKTINTNLNILISPTYGGKLLPSFDDFIKKNEKILSQSLMAFFIVCLEKSHLFDENKNLKILKNYTNLHKNIIFQDAVFGKRIFHDLNHDDKQKLMFFYKNIQKLNDKEIFEKQKPQNFINEKDIHKSIDNLLEKFNFK